MLSPYIKKHLMHIFGAKSFFYFLLCLVFISFNAKSQTSTFRIAFGSCAHEDHPLPVFNTIIKQKPNLFIFLGDNIYADTDDPEVMRQKYKLLSANKGFKKLIKTTPVIATWDDHDYGRNDAGRHYPMKEESKNIFLDFFNEPINSPRRKREGIYTSYFYQTAKETIQIILLDTRTFRDNLIPFKKGIYDDPRFFYERDYLPHTTSDSTLLGEVQWAWLRDELKKKADIRIIASSTQFGIEYNGYESWANFPHEQQRMIDLIKETKASGVFFVSGDVHYAELSSIQPKNCYPMYDLTASGLSSTWDFSTPNKNRIGNPVMQNHFGLLTINTKKERTNILMEIIDVAGNIVLSHSISLSELQF
jgi:alkaline phosphatase D